MSKAKTVNNRYTYSRVTPLYSDRYRAALYYFLTYLQLNRRNERRKFYKINLQDRLGKTISQSIIRTTANMLMCFGTS